MGAIEDIVDWSAKKLAPWRQDALRRLASSSAISDQDESELLDLIKDKAGFQLAAKPPAPKPLTKAHFSGVTSGSPLQIKGIRDVKNVNRLVPAAALAFMPNGLTIAYGRNGSGKSGFVRIFRTACRTRTDNPAKLRVLADVYGSGGGPQEAEIVVDLGNGADVVVPWVAGAPASDTLLQVAVFDSSAAQFYVDGGNQIQFLPFGLALPHKLNELCITLKDTLEAERKPIADQIGLATVIFEKPRTTNAQAFYNGLSAKTTDIQINAAAAFSPDDEKRIGELMLLLASGAASAADVTALSTWVENLAAECINLGQAFGDAKLTEYRALKQQAIDARTAAGLKAADLFSSEPLPGVGSETWRRLWLAARDYSITDAFPEREFPVVSTLDTTASCVLCQQPLSAEASTRMSSFQDFVSGALAKSADEAEAFVAQAITSLPKIEAFTAKDWATRLEQIRKRHAEIADAVASFKASVEARRAVALASLQGIAAPFISAPAVLVSPGAELKSLAQTLSGEAEALAKADEGGERAKLDSELAELADRKVLAAGRERVITRRDLLKANSLYAAALTEVQTKGITQKANELVDTHLTKIVIDHFEVEREALEINHLKVALARKSGQTKAAFQTTPGTTLTKLTSDILSEGEQRALALAAFLTEIAVTDGVAPIVLDDPVSSLDRERGLRVAARIAAEAQKRQVIVFTHDLIFFNDLCREADALGVPTETIALFADGANAGKIDPAGVSWKGLSVSKRLAKIRNDFAPLKKLYTLSSSNYEFSVKNLYGRLRDSYERLVEEHIFCDVVRRGVDRIETQKLRMVHLSDALAVRFHDGMTKANTYSHDNPASDTVSVPAPTEFEADLASIEKLIADLKSESALAEANRPTMKPKKD